jgi:hypothetical protein
MKARFIGKCRKRRLNMYKKLEYETDNEYVKWAKKLVDELGWFYL